MKNLIIIILCSISHGVFAQAELNKKLEFTGSGSDAKIEGIDEIINDKDAVNKIYVDTAIANRAGSGGGGSDLLFSLSTDNTATTGPINGNSESIIPVTLTVQYLSGEGDAVALQVLDVPSGVVVDLTPSGGYPSFDAALNFFPGLSATPGSYPIKVKAVGPNNTDSVTVTLTVVPGNRVFLSSNQYNGNFGGISGADGTCQSLADAQSLGGTWMAWLSSGSSSPSTCFTQSSSYYFLLDGTPIASSWADLTDDELLNGISQDELGSNYLPSSELVWSNTAEDGTIDGSNHCNNWTSSSGGFNGRGGRNSPNSDWYSCCTEACDGSTGGLLRLYCFEQ